MLNVGVISSYTCGSYALSGPISRSCGFSYDLRQTSPYEVFTFIQIPVLIGIQGDNFTRFFLRLEEILVSLQVISTILVYLDEPIRKQKKEKDVTMENVISEFKLFSEGSYIGKNSSSYTSIESPKGEFGVCLTSDVNQANRPYRLKIRAPGFYNLSSLNVVSKNYLISDLLSFLSTLDLILGEVDR